MRRPAVQPRFNFNTQLTLETHERRQRLQRHFGCSAAELVEEAFRKLEAGLDSTSEVEQTAA
jgi:hypothetical protein